MLLNLRFISLAMPQLNHHNFPINRLFYALFMFEQETKLLMPATAENNHSWVLKLISRRASGLRVSNSLLEYLNDRNKYANIVPPEPWMSFWLSVIYGHLANIFPCSGLEA